MTEFLTHCRVCGWDHGDYIWGASGDEASFEICECCGTEFGYEDSTVESTRNKRREWIMQGLKWFKPKSMPNDWKFEDYKLFIPEKYR